MKISDKLPTEQFSGGRYSIVAWARGHQVLYYREFGSYQGEWIMISFLKKEYYIWKGYFGSCSGCDSYEAEMSYGDEIYAADEKTRKFIEDYKPFLEVPSSTFRNLAKQGPEAIGRITPKNIRSEYTDIPWESLFADICLLVKAKEKLSVTVSEILKASDQEIKQAALKSYGYEKFVKDSGAKILEKHKDCALIGIEDIKLLSLKDSSTNRKYLLRVPPEIKTYREGVAWTFGLSADAYNPAIET